PVGTTPAVAATPSPARVERGDEAPVPTVLPGDPPGTIENYEVSPVTFELRDGVLVVDGRYHVRGEGTQANPYRVPWELLTSVGTAFEPREGRKTIPGRVAFLEGKWVRIAGYVSFPLMTRQPRELLAMLNQWDGCCIGVPPTPYDAIEVNLSKALTGNDAFAIAGTVTGEFHIRPYLMGDWLVGLYVMEHGSLQATEFGGPGGF
ncbi:MAG TPA: hypothetical protein VNN12_05555, partial [Dehalococcoidia bacterium]|nr:hypothetical protein [Dehalococcoidia bacterium]